MSQGQSWGPGQPPPGEPKGRPLSSERTEFEQAN